MKFVIEGGAMLDDVMEEIRAKLGNELAESTSEDENRYINFEHIIIEVLK